MTLCFENLFSNFLTFLSFLSPQVRAEFKRVVSTDLLESFLDGLDDLAPRLLEVYEAATKSAKKPALKAILDCLKKDVSIRAENCKIGHQMFAIKSQHCLFLSCRTQTKGEGLLLCWVCHTT